MKRRRMLINYATQLNLNNFATTMGDCVTGGFVVSTNSNYAYTTAPTATVNGNSSLRSNL